MIVVAVGKSVHVVSHAGAHIAERLRRIGVGAFEIFGRRQLAVQNAAFKCRDRNSSPLHQRSVVREVVQVFGGGTTMRG